MFVYELSGSGFESSCSNLNFRFLPCFEQGVPWHSGNYRVWMHSEKRTWQDKNIVFLSVFKMFTSESTTLLLTVRNIWFEQSLLNIQILNTKIFREQTFEFFRVYSNQWKKGNVFSFQTKQNIGYYFATKMTDDSMKKGNEEVLLWKQLTAVSRSLFLKKKTSS